MARLHHRIRQQLALSWRWLVRRVSSAVILLVDYVLHVVSFSEWILWFVRIYNEFEGTITAVHCDIYVG